MKKFLSVLIVALVATLNLQSVWAWGTVGHHCAAYIAEQSFSAKYGARNMRRYIQRHVEDPLAEAVIADYEHTIKHIRLSVANGELSVVCQP